YFDGATNVEAALQKIGAAAIISSPARPEQFGAVGDGSTNDTASILATLASGKKEIRLDGEYSCGLVTIPDGIRLLSGRGTIKQRAAGTNLLSLNSVDGLTISVNLLGAAGLGVTPASSNDLISAVDCDDL